jgi:hypothetical protein
MMCLAITVFIFYKFKVLLRLGVDTHMKPR